jgi:hypothetical protein
MNPKTDEWKAAYDQLKGYREELSEIIKLNEKIPKREKNLTELQGQRGIKFGEYKSNIKTGYNEESGLFFTEEQKQEMDDETRMYSAQVDAYLKAKEGFRLKKQLENDKILDDEAAFNRELASLIDSGMRNAIESFATGITDMLIMDLGGKDFGLQLLDMVGKFMITLGMLMITTGKAYQGFVASLSKGDGIGALGWGIALVAAGAVATSYAKKGLKEAAASSSASPASGYSSNMGSSSATNALQGAVVFELRGNVLQGVLNNNANRNVNIR